MIPFWRTLKFIAGLFLNTPPFLAHSNASRRMSHALFPATELFLDILLLIRSNLECVFVDNVEAERKLFDFLEVVAGRDCTEREMWNIL